MPTGAGGGVLSLVVVVSTPLLLEVCVPVVSGSDEDPVSSVTVADVVAVVVVCASLLLCDELSEVSDESADELLSVLVLSFPPPELSAQAAIDSTIAIARTIARNFFILFPPL
jgi:hypothetical protein